MSADAPLRLDILIRTSQRKKESRSPEQQEDVCRRCAEINGYDIVAVHDSGKSESGKTMKRETVDAVKERVRAGKTDGVIVAWLDRLGRAPIEEAMTEVRELIALGGKLVPADGSGGPIDLDDPQAETMLVMQLQWARQQWRQTARRFEMSRKNAIAEGKAVGGLKWGYAFKDPTPKSGGRGVVDSRLVVDEDRRGIVRELFERKAARGTWLELARWLDEVDPKEEGRLWARNSVSAIIKSRTYLGEAHHGEYSNLRSHEALVSPSLWRRAQNEPGRRSPRGTYLLTGIVRCAGCGRSMRGTSLGMNKGRYFTKVYECATPECTSRSTIMVDRLDREVASRLSHVEIEVADAPAANGSELAVARADVQRLTMEVETVASVPPRRPEAVEAYRIALADVERELDEAEKRVDALEAAASPWSFDGFRRAWSEWEGTTAEERALRAEEADRLMATDPEAYEGPEMPLDALREHLRQAVDCVLVRRAKNRGPASDIPYRVLVLLKGEAPNELRQMRGPIASWAWGDDASTLALAG